MSVEEVIERGREAGLQINASDVHSVRFYMRRESAFPTLATSKSKSRAAQPLAVAPAPSEAPEPERTRITRELVPKPARVPTARDRARGKAQAARRISAEEIVRSTKRVVQNTRKRESPTNASLSPEGQLRVLLLRLGTDYAREIIAQLENMRVPD